MSVKNRLVVAAGALALAISPLIAAPARADDDSSNLEKQRTLAHATKTLLVRFEDHQADASGSARTAVAAAAEDIAGVDISEVVPITPELVAVRFDATLEDDELAQIRKEVEAEPGVEDVNGSATVTTQATSDGYYDWLWDLASGSVGSIDAEAVWPITTGSGVVVGVLDTGVTAHPDLTASSTATVGGNVVAGYDFISDPDFSGDGGGRDKNPSDAGDVCYPDFSSWHGTHVAGTIASLANNGRGVAGVAPTVKVQPIRVMGRCGGDEADLIAAIRWGAGLAVTGVPANSTPADVLNLSLGGAADTCPVEVQEAIDAAVSKGTAVVVAAGNDASPIAKTFPANCNNVVRVTASTGSGAMASFSNYGSGAVPATVAAPGVNILSTSNTGLTSPKTATYVQMSGTSMAAPHVSAALALLESVDPTLTASQAIAILTESAVALGGDCVTYRCGAGLVSLPAAVKSLGPFTAVRPATTSGTFKVGKTLTAKKGTWSPSGVKVNYRWLRNGAAISKATKSTYKLTKADRKKSISVRVRVYADGIASASSTSAAKKVS